MGENQAPEPVSGQVSPWEADAPAAPAGSALPPPVASMVGRAKALRRRFQRFEGLAFFLAGSAWDALTLTRIDRLTDNLILLSYVLLLGALLVLRRRLEKLPERWPRLVPHEEKIGFAVQFLFGGLYSAYVIFYGKSAASDQSLLFVGLLLGLLLANEFLHDRLRGRRLRVGLFTFCTFSFLLFFIPVLTGWLGRGVFTVAALCSFGVGALVVWLAERMPGAVDLTRQALRQQLPVVGGVLLLLGGLDLLQLIPPVPLALMKVGIYHDVRRVEGGYELVSEPGPWWSFADDDSAFLRREGDKVWCFSAVFAPTGTGIAVVHRWELQDPDSGDWKTTDTIPFEVMGGRQGGFRGYTRKQNVQDGRWRVVVETGSGRVLGRHNFTVQSTDAETERVWSSRLAD